MVVPGMEGRAAAEKLKWGLKLKLDVKKPVIGLAAHPREQQIAALFGDGVLRGYALGQGGLVPTFAIAGAQMRGAGWGGAGRAQGGTGRGAACSRARARRGGPRPGTKRCPPPPPHPAHLA